VRRLHVPSYLFPERECTDVKIDKLHGKVDELTRITKAIQGGVDTIRKIVK
jgi:hypothetical protein